MKLKSQGRWFLLLIILSIAFLGLGLTFGNKAGEIHKNLKLKVVLSLCASVMMSGTVVV